MKGRDGRPDEQQLRLLPILSESVLGAAFLSGFFGFE
jgi:hypothetical protein